MTVHMWNDEQVDIFCGYDGPEPLDFVTREDVDHVDCVECLRAAVAFGERCRARIAALSLPWAHNLGASLAYAGMLWTAHTHGRDVLLGDVARMLDG